MTLNEGLTTIKESTFEGCSSLASIIIPNSVKTIGMSVFSGCSSLISIEIPKTVTSIDKNAFYGCTSLTTVVIGDGVIRIGKNAFAYCEALSSVTFENASGWLYEAQTEEGTTTDISESDLLNTSTAAEFLKNTYCDYNWYIQEDWYYGNIE